MTWWKNLTLAAIEMRVKLYAKFHPVITSEETILRLCMHSALYEISVKWQ